MVDKPVDYIEAMPPEDLRMNLRNAYANTRAQEREIRMQYRLIAKQRQQVADLLEVSETMYNLMQSGGTWTLQQQWQAERAINEAKAAK